MRKKTEEEEKLLKLLQGIPRPQDGFTQWCEQMLHTLSTTGSLDGTGGTPSPGGRARGSRRRPVGPDPPSCPTVPMAVAILKEVESPYDVHDYIRSCLGDTLEAKEFAKQFLERRAKQKASQQRQQQVRFHKALAGGGEGAQSPLTPLFPLCCFAGGLAEQWLPADSLSDQPQHQARPRGGQQGQEAGTDAALGPQHLG